MPWDDEPREPRRVRRVKLMADYMAFPLWAEPGDEASTAEDIWAGMLSSDDLPLSPSLVTQLQDWADRHDALLGPTFEWPSVAAREAFVEDGRNLLSILRGELGSDFDVVYFNEITGEIER